MPRKAGEDLRDSVKGKLYRGNGAVFYVVGNTRRKVCVEDCSAGRDFAIRNLTTGKEGTLRYAELRDMSRIEYTELEGVERDRFFER